MTDFPHDALERFESLPTLRQVHIDWLLANGVPVGALHRPDVLRVASMQFLDGGLFDFQDEAHAGEPFSTAIIFYVAEPEDLVAWTPRSRRIANWFGRTPVLGDALGLRLDPDGALLVHRDPLDWLRAAREGVVIIDPGRAAIHLDDCGPVLGEDLAHARELHTILNLPGPDIRVPSACLEQVS